MKQRIQQLKQEKNAVILAHYYVCPEVQEVADHVGDSFYLAKVAKETDAQTIVFCGVSFMGESAKILNPEKTVLMPDLSADCPMAHMVADGAIRAMRAAYEDLAVVCYVNSDIALKCQSDVCVTSSNAVHIVKNLPNRNIFFIPDQNLGRYVAQQVPEKNIILNSGFCPIHQAVSAQALQQEKERHPQALVLTHPECPQEVLELSDYIGSTADIIRYAKQSECQSFIICTEAGVLHRLQQENPEKEFFFVSPTPICPGMKQCSLEKLVHVLETGENAVALEESMLRQALIPLDKMLELAK